jgi:hypothetical protein
VESLHWRAVQKTMVLGKTDLPVAHGLLSVIPAPNGPHPARHTSLHLMPGLPYAVHAPWPRPHRDRTGALVHRYTARAVAHPLHRPLSGVHGPQSGLQIQRSAAHGRVRGRHTAPVRSARAGVPAHKGTCTCRQVHRLVLHKRRTATQMPWSRAHRRCVALHWSRPRLHTARESWHMLRGTRHPR